MPTGTVKSINLLPKKSVSVTILTPSNIKKEKREVPSVPAKDRWRAIKKLVTKTAETRAQQDENEEVDRTKEAQNRRNLIDEVRRAKGHANAKISLLSVLKTQADLTEKVFEKQKFSAKEILTKKRRSTHTGKTRNPQEEESIAEYNRQAELRYTITPAIQEKLDRIKIQNQVAAAKKRKSEADPGASGFFLKLLSSTIFGQILQANPRFYTMDPQEHLPELCRRCRRPLVDTLEGHFTSIGILFCILLPIIGILLMYANREFVCVICEEVYVYGEMTARPDDNEEEEVTGGGGAKKSKR